MPDLVGVDHSTPARGDDLYHTGVAVEVDNVSEFREYYFDVVRDFCSKYNIETPFPVIKSKTIIDNLATFEIGEAVPELAKNLLQNPAISRVHVSIGWYDDSAYLEFDDTELSAPAFANEYMKQFFPVITLWKYHSNNPTEFPRHAFIDDVQGPANQAWKYVASEFNVRLIPHGDMTYPSISTADILSYNLSTYLPEDEPFSEYAGIAGSWLIRHKDRDVDPYIGDSEANSKDASHIVPSLKYNVQSDLHYPHPVIFLYDELLSKRGEVLPLTDLHAFARKYAYQNGGSVVGLDEKRLPKMVKSGDKIVYSREEDSDLPRLFQQLHPTKDIELLNPEQLADSL